MIELPTMAPSPAAPAGRGSGPVVSCLAMGGAALTAAASTACCWLPPVLIALCGSSAGAGAFLSEYRTVFLASTTLLLAVAWYFTLSARRPRPAPAAGGGGCCAPPPAGDCCVGGSRNLRVRAAVLVAMTAFAALSGFRPDLLRATSAAGTMRDCDEGDAYRVTVGGLDCECAARLLQTDLQAAFGAAGVRVDAAARTVRVARGAAGPTAGEVRAAVEAAGYDVVRIEPWTASASADAGK